MKQEAANEKRKKIMFMPRLWRFVRIDFLFSALGGQETVNYAFSFLNLVCSSRDVTPRCYGHCPFTAQ